MADAALHQAHLRALLAHVVAVQVDPGGILAGTGTQGAILAAEMFDLQLAVLRIDAVIAVGVEQRRHQQGEAVQKRAMTPAEQIAHQHQGRLFSLHFAGVNAALNQYHGQPRTHRILGCEAAMIGENQERQKAPFRGAAEIRDAQPRVAPDAQRLDERQHVGMGGGLTVAGALGARQRALVKKRQHRGHLRTSKRNMKPNNDHSAMSFHSKGMPDCTQSG